MLYSTRKHIDYNDSRNNKTKANICWQIKMLLEIYNTYNRYEHNAQCTPNGIGNPYRHGF